VREKDRNQGVHDNEAQAVDALHEVECIKDRTNCSECFAVLSPKNRARWGITRRTNDLECECHMICVQDVLLICAMEDQYVDIPVCLCDGTPSCRGSLVGPFEPVSCEAFVTCASEELQEDCDGVNIRIGFQAVVKCDNTFVVCQTEVFKKCNFFDFFTFPDGKGFPKTASGRRDFQELVRKVDGSCLDIDLKSCDIIDTANPRVRIRFKFVDKLWKHENLLVSAIRPFGGRYDDERDIVVKREFGPPQLIPECDDDEVNGPQ
jgi:hypothetical protein